MWTCAELKKRAKMNLRRYLVPAFFVSFIFLWVSGATGRSTSSFESLEELGGESGLTQEIPGEIPGNLSEFDQMIPSVESYTDSLLAAFQAIEPEVWAMIGMAVAVAMVISILIKTFLISVMEVGKNRFYMESREYGLSAGVDRLRWGFSNHYLNIVWTMFLRDLFITIGNLFCLIPGIYLSYCFQMVPYILAENPDMKAMDVLRLSNDMVDGHKFKSFVLELSFVGWWILGAFTCNIATYMAQPYYDATFAELYAVLRQPFMSYLRGFRSPENDAYEAARERNGYRDAGEYRPEYEAPQYEPQGNGGYADGGEEIYVESREVPAEEHTEVKRSEGGPGRGYYLNGVFYPYTDEELDQLDRNR